MTTTVLFVGDSVTDTEWRTDTPEQLGHGYVRMIAGTYVLTHPSATVRFVNRGTSGDRVRDLQARWGSDVLASAPDVVSVLVGINDTWRRYDSDDPTSLEAFESGYAELLEQSAAAGSRLVLMEPFLLDRVHNMRYMREDLDPKIEAVRRLARQFGAVIVGTDDLFTRAANFAPAERWAWDGIHPTAAGHALIARAWLSAIDL